MFYGAVVWDPWLIVAQIVCLQCLYYLTLGFFLSFLVGTRVSRLTLVYFFDFATITTSTVTGWCVIASLLLTSFAGAGYMLSLIERAKKCLDFSATLYIIHLFICIIYGGWPSSITWWVVNGTGLAVMALFGEYLCIRRELREIPLSIPRYRSNIVDEEGMRDTLPDDDLASPPVTSFGLTMLKIRVVLTNFVLVLELRRNLSSFLIILDIHFMISVFCNVTGGESIIYTTAFLQYVCFLFSVIFINVQSL